MDLEVAGAGEASSSAWLMVDSSGRDVEMVGNLPEG
jgi:hypothetical protein